MDPMSDQTRVVAGFLRHLWFGLATFRLYPERPYRSGFLESVAQIGDAAAPLLGSGPLEIEISSDGFSVGGVDLPSDEALERLALACFARRTELLRVMAVPSAQDLEALFTALTAPPDELERNGGMPPPLPTVTSLALLRIGPSVHSEPGRTPIDELDTDRDLSTSTAPPLASWTEGLSGSIDDQADIVLRRLRDAATIDVPPSGADRGADPVAALAALPEGLRRAVVRRLLEEGPADPLAGRLIGSLSNAELSRAIVALEGAGGDPTEIAQGLADAGIRTPDIVDLTNAILAGLDDGTTIFAGLEQIGSPLAALDPDVAVEDIIARHLLASQPSDQRALLDLSASNDRQAATSSLATLQDYLALQDEVEQFASTADVWVEATRDALVSRDHTRVLGLVEAVESSSDLRSGRPFVEVYAPLVLDAAVVEELMDPRSTAEGPTAFELLAPFGDSSVEALFVRLAEEEDRGRRAALLGSLHQLAPGRADAIVRHLDDARWYVVRNAVNVLRYSRHPRTLELMARAARHTAEGVRKEAVFGLAAAGEVAAPHLGTLAVGPDDSVRVLAIEALGELAGPEAAAQLARVVTGSSSMEMRRRALEALANNPSTEASRLLDELSGRRSRPRLPRSLRRRARLLAQGHSRGPR